jgi:hypothetical protein
MPAKPAATAKSGAIAFAFPDVCLTPTPGGNVPLPYPNIAQLADASPVADTLTIGGDPALHASSQIDTSSGNEAGSSGGVKSTTTKGACTFTSFSLTVVYGPDGDGLVRFLDSTDQNRTEANGGNAVGMVLGAVPTVLIGD